MKKATEWIEALDLLPHPEGGYYRRTEESSERIAHNGINRPLYTSIYFLLTPESLSHFHCLVSDEVWYFHEGSRLTIHCIKPEDTYYTVNLGNNIKAGEILHYRVPQGVIFGSSVEEGYALVSCMVSPGFDFADFELFTQKQLVDNYPQHREIIEKLAYQEIPGN